ncbi:MAG: hypothetical protein DSY77_07265 [Bacteroidetes bacterium]|nr:MAG: hypothetical protein DSY77_07265 [Bacteroidota bacterium]
MKIEKKDNEILVRIPSNVDITGLQKILDYIKFREITSKSQASQEDIDALARESKKSWWEKNKDKYIK